MSRTRTASRCSACGHDEPRWVGRCPSCSAWGTMSDEVQVARPVTEARRSAAPTALALPLAEVPVDAVRRLRTGIGEFDRALGGGLVPGEVVLLGGEPGVGKSTLLLQAARAIAAGSSRPVLYVAAEESAGQVRLRAERLGALHPRLLVAAVDDLSTVEALVAEHAPVLAIVDSIQTIASADQPGAAGSVAQVRACAAALTRVARSTGMATVLVGHVTKDGALAGPRVLEHLVDAVLTLEGDRHHALRLVRATKNRFGPAGEVGCFEMTGDGMVAVSDPSRLFLATHGGAVPGVAVTVTVEGPRPLPVEVQALAADTTLAQPRRQSSGLDGARLPLLVAVLERRAGIPLGAHDLYASAVGGVRLREPAADLALCVAIASAVCDVAVRQGTVIIGEVGLAGEVRTVPRVDRRLAEAARLGVTRAVVPAGYDGPDHGLALRGIADVASALRAVGVSGSAARPGGRGRTAAGVR